jgi:hypothetical protein
MLIYGYRFHQSCPELASEPMIEIQKDGAWHGMQSIRTPE